MQIGTDNVLSFSPLRLSDAGQYTCQATVSSPYLNNDITMMGTQDVTLQSEFSYKIHVYTKTKMEVLWWTTLSNNFTLGIIIQSVHMCMQNFHVHEHPIIRVCAIIMHAKALNLAIMPCLS